MNTEWINIRPFNGDVKNGFEELVCQLARAENFKDSRKFIRVAAPDGGVEAYWVFNDNSEFGWQAKYFTTMGDSQWNQLEESFTTALTKHPNLKKYYICTPLDRQDPRIVTKNGTAVKHFMDVWNEKVEKWQKQAFSLGRDIEFEYWGNSELFERLTEPKNEGKLHYWFGKEELSDNWFKSRLEESIQNLGKRYTPELNFDLPISKTFEGISRDNYFKKQVILKYHEVLKNYNKALSHVRIEKVKDSIEKIDASITEFTTLFENLDFSEIQIINQESLTSALEKAEGIIQDLIYKFYELDSNEKKASKEKKEYVSDTNTYGWDIENFRKLNSSIYSLINFINSSTFNLSNNPILILAGEAGIGKSHLLADVAKRRESRNQHTILLLGQQFSTTEDPWTQISKLLQINLNRDAFLAALDSKAQSSEARLLIFIDAINEGEGKLIWENHMASFITAIKRFPNLGVVFSVRTSYEKLLIPEVIKEKKDVVRIVHQGFQNHEYEASKLFFKNYKIKQPSIPLLHPEFSNPLFLKLFCEGLNKKGLHEIPNGYEGITAIIGFFLDAVNSKISKSHNLPVNINIVQKVLGEIAIKISDTNNSYLRYDDAFVFITEMKETKAIINKSQFFQDLISEGILTQNLYWEKNGNHFEGIYISYERFSDHLIASNLLDKFLNKKNPKKSFSKESRFSKIIKMIFTKLGLQFDANKLYDLLKTESEARFNRGILEALSVQLPEKVGVELYEAASHAREFEPVAVAFIESIIWRKKETLNEKLKEFINEIVIGKFDYNSYFLSTILLVTSHPQNYFNSDFLHNHLLRFKMSDRDAWWTQYIHNKFPGYPDEPTPIKRLIDWAWNDESKDYISDESIRLTCQTLIWFLASCNRTLRDSSTKALITLLEDRIHVIIQLIQNFRNVNDPYILQRVYAVAYGCAVRTNQIELLKPLGDCIYENVFSTDNVYPDILLRDYAKGVIEYSIFKGIKFSFDLTNVYPPYSSELPANLPSNEETDKYKFDYDAEDFKKYQWSQNSILNSMVTEYGRGTAGYGDFGRYVFQSGLSNWRVDENGLSNLAIKWIIEKYGYNVEKHGDFDRNIGSGRGRDNYREERIGKKYQWIAFYEILARVADNYPMYENSYSENAEPIKYEGPWNPYVRDIDPTITLKGYLEEIDELHWWQLEYSNWNILNNDWIFLTKDLPNILDLICVKDPQDVEWLVLENYSDWNEPTPIGEEKYESPHKRLFYDLSSHIIHKKDLARIIEYLSNRNLRGCGLSESSSRYEMFSREYYWASANETFKSEYYGGSEWDDLYNRKSGELIGKTARTAIQYRWEEEFDASKEDTIAFYKPTELIFKLLNLRYSKVEGEFINSEAEVICFDPSAIIQTKSCLLVRKNDLINVLSR